jgi:hypothetical protein
LASVVGGAPSKLLTGSDRAMPVTEPTPSTVA